MTFKVKWLNEIPKVFLNLYFFMIIIIIFIFTASYSYVSLVFMNFIRMHANLQYVFHGQTHDGRQCEPELLYNKYVALY